MTVILIKYVKYDSLNIINYTNSLILIKIIESKNINILNKNLIYINMGQTYPRKTHYKIDNVSKHRLDNILVAKLDDISNIYN